MDVEKRMGKGPIPSKLAFYVTEKQIISIQILKKFGWMLEFIRRPVFSNVTPVLRNIHDSRVGILQSDGALKISSDIKLRMDTEPLSIQENPHEPPVEIEIRDKHIGRYDYPSLFNSHFLDQEDTPKSPHGNQP